MIWNLEELHQVPKMYKTDKYKVHGFESIFYEGLNYKGRRNRVYAYYGIPEGHPPDNGWPAVVLVHGGGGTAFYEWVHKWVEHGYAAISMDLEGHLPDLKLDYDKRPQHTASGPARKDVFADIDKPLTEQWMYHAVADVILAHSLIGSMEEVDSSKIGLTGISWGGIITSIVTGVDQRFKFAIPVYGCGYLFASKGSFGPAMNNNKKLWDPSNYLHEAAMPMLWINGDEDSHFSLNAFVKSYLQVKDNSVLSIHPGMDHGHQPGWAPQEIYTFADSVIKDESSLVNITAQEIKENKFIIDYETEVPLKKAELIYTEIGIEYDSDFNFTGGWKRKEVESQKGQPVEVEIPGNAKMCYVNLIDDRDLIVSSDLIEITGAIRENAVKRDIE